MAEHTIAAIYTGAALVKPLSDLMKETLGDYKIMNILDDSMIADIIEAGMQYMVQGSFFPSRSFELMSRWLAGR
jgi:hypothetical protein